MYKTNVHVFLNMTLHVTSKKNWRIAYSSTVFKAVYSVIKQW